MVSTTLVSLLLCLQLVEGFHRPISSSNSLFGGYHDGASFVSLGGWHGTSSSRRYGADVEDDSYDCPIDVSRWNSSAEQQLQETHERAIEFNDEPWLASSTKTKGRLPRRSKRWIRRQRRNNGQGEEQSGTISTHSSPATESETEYRQVDYALLRQSVTQPIIPKEMWEQLTGDEFDEPDVVDALVEAGLHMATHHVNKWVAWKGDAPTNMDAALDAGEILVYTGTASHDGFGTDVPWIKSFSILPFSPSELADLMMDSTRVKTYNSLSMGRTDLRTMPPRDAKQQDDAAQQQLTKIVRNMVKLPVTNSKVESCTMLHSRKLENGAYLLVSRAVGGTKYSCNEKNVSKSYILFGMNLFEPIAENGCRMTAITHVFQPGVPVMLAGKVGVKSAKNFVKDIRALCVPVQ